MSRRVQNPSAERTAANQQILKNLVKVESNKTCADCKRNKHPRWASWNLGVFICIRCSGVHRGMGTHISRVKSVDLDAWTDEQMQSILRWGNSRANKYWESKLAPGHVPSDAKMENFIRTKYESKRWVMDGPMPDPATLDTGEEDEAPLSVVQEKVKTTSATTSRHVSTSSQPPPIPKAVTQVDLFGDDPPPPASAPAPAPPASTARPASAASTPSAPPPPPKNEPTALKQHKASDSLLGFDFFGGGGQAGPPVRPASAASGTSASNIPSRPDLKQSILSLYATAPKPATSPPPTSQQPAASSFNQVGASPPPSQGNFGTLNSDFSSLSFGSTSQSPPSVQSPPVSTSFFGNPEPANQKNFSAASPPAIPKQQSGGGFFDPKPTVATSTPQASNPPAPQRGLSSSSGFGDWTSMTSPTNTSAPKPSNTGGGGGLMDFSTSPQQSVPPATTAYGQTSPTTNSPFNLSTATQPKSPPPIGTATAKPTAAPAFPSMGVDPWGSNDAWASSASPPKPAPPAKALATVSAPANDWGWTDAASAKPAQVTKDEDYGGGWGGSTNTPAKPASQPHKPLGGGFGGNDDLFSNVWE